MLKRSRDFLFQVRKFLFIFTSIIKSGKYPAILHIMFC